MIDLDKLKSLQCLLLYFDPNDYEIDTTDKDIVNIMVSDFENITVTKVLQEGQEVLAMDPFPWEWVQDVSQTLVYDEQKKQWVEDPIIYKKWLTKILTMLQEEAIKVGKLKKPTLKGPVWKK